jgi:hypothetical protein
MRRNDQSILFTGRTYRPHYVFWKKQLLLVDEGFSFTGGLVNQPGADRQLKEFRFELDDEAQQTVAHLSHGNDLESAVVHLSAFVYLLSRVSNERVVVIESPLLSNARIEEVHT